MLQRREEERLEKKRLREEEKLARQKKREEAKLEKELQKEKLKAEKQVPLLGKINGHKSRNFRRGHKNSGSIFG